MTQALQQLKTLYLAESRRKHPLLPESVRTCPPYSDRTANGLTKCIIDFLKLSGHFAERINTTGRPIDQRKQITDVIGRTRTIGTMKWIPGTGTRGSADIHSVIKKGNGNGIPVMIEVKCKATNDRQSEAQKRYQEQVERAGGIYFIATSFEQFIAWFTNEFGGLG